MTVTTSNTQTVPEYAIKPAEGFHKIRVSHYVMSHEKEQVNTICAGDVNGPANYVSSFGTYGRGEVRIRPCQINTSCIHRLVECRTHEKLT